MLYFTGTTSGKSNMNKKHAYPWKIGIIQPHLTWTQFMNCQQVLGGERRNYVQCPSNTSYYNFLHVNVL